MSKLRQRSLFGALALVLGAAMFLVASAFVIDRGYPKVIAAIVGGLAFPVLPLAWHVWGEHGRKAKLAAIAAAVKPGKPAPKASTLTAYDRFWMRFVAVALVVIGPMVGFARFGVVRAAVRHATWFVPEFVPGIGGLGEGPRRSLKRVDALLERVPGEAEVVVVVMPPGVTGEGMIASDGHEVVAAGEGDVPHDDAMIHRINAVFRAMHFLPLEPLAMLLDRDLTVAASDKWKTKVEPAPKGLSTGLRRELERAPEAAALVAAFTPKTVKDARSIRAGAVWVTTQKGQLVIEARIEALDVAHAYALITTAKQLVAEKLPIVTDCKAVATKLLGALELAQVGAVLTARVAVSAELVGELDRCSN